MPSLIDKCKGVIWEPEIWNNLYDFPHLEYTNCYSYAFNTFEFYQDLDRGSKLNPGGLSSGQFKGYSCEIIIQKMKEDYPDIQGSSFYEVLEPLRYKIALVYDSNSVNNDFHFYRQDCNTLWSHKPGKNKITNKDASGYWITNPQYCDRDYSSKEDGHHYDKFCGFFSVLKKEINIRNNSS